MNLNTYNIKRYRTKFIQKNSDGELFCYKCKQYKSSVLFDNSPQESDVFYREGKDRRCKECKKKQYIKRREGNRGKKDLNRILLERLHGTKERSYKKNLINTLTLEDLRDIWKSQKGKCAISGIDMTYIFNKGRIYTNVSIDRIYPNKGYTKNNIQLVCMVINQMKSDLTLNELKYYCHKIINNES